MKHLRNLAIVFCIFGFGAWLLLSGAVESSKEPLMVPNRDKLKVDAKAQRELLSMFEEFGKRAQQLGEDESDTTKQWEEFDAKRLRELRQFMSKYPDAQSLLTAILAYANVVSDLPEEHPTVFEAFGKLRREHPESWQAQFLGKFEARLLSSPAHKKTDARVIEESKKQVPGEDFMAREIRVDVVEKDLRKKLDLDAIKILKAALPEKEPIIDWNDPELKALGKLTGVQSLPPLRAGYLLAIAGYEYNMVGNYGATNRVEATAYRLQWYEKAKKSYERVIQEYPGSEAAKQASKVISTIELELSLKAEPAQKK